MFLKNKFFLLFFLMANSFIYSWYQLVSLKDFLTEHSEVIYIPCKEEVFFDYDPFPLSINPAGHPNMGFFDQNYILKAPNARIISMYGFMYYKNQFIKELRWKNNTGHIPSIFPTDDQVIKISGKVATISVPPYINYWHWISEVLCRLALLEIENIEYDYIYVPQTSSYMKETLALWGISENKIISPTDQMFCIQADEIIVPSMVVNVNFNPVDFACYAQPYLLEYVRNKLLSAVQKKGSSFEFSKHVFISRKDTNLRQIINEDQFFDCLKQHGFARYELGKMSVVDQILLFNQAEVIVAAQGTGLANSIFCNKKVKIFELFQRLNDATFWYLTQDFGLNYTPIKTVEFYNHYIKAYKEFTEMPLEIVDQIITLIKQ